MNKFNKWLDLLISEKNIKDVSVEVEGESGLNVIPMTILAERIKSAPASEQEQIKNTLIKIDFHNGDVMNFFNHLAQAIAI